MYTCIYSVNFIAFGFKLFSVYIACLQRFVLWMYGKVVYAKVLTKFYDFRQLLNGKTITERKQENASIHTYDWYRSVRSAKFQIFTEFVDNFFFLLYMHMYVYVCIWLKFNNITKNCVYIILSPLELKNHTNLKQLGLARKLSKKSKYVCISR